MCESTLNFDQINAKLDTWHQVICVVPTPCFAIGDDMSLEEFGRYVIEFVSVHEAWVAPIVFVLAFAELLAFVSLILPSWTVLVSGGFPQRGPGLRTADGVHHRSGREGP